MTAMRTREPILAPVDSDRPDTALSTDELGSRIVGLAGRLAAATCRWLLLVAEFDRRDGCHRFGLNSTARWLSHHCGLARRTALEHLRVARALADFPALASEMTSGHLSYSQVRAISRVPKAGEHTTVDDLIQVARSGSASQLEVVVRGMRTVANGDSIEAPEEYVRHSWTAQSQWGMTARLRPERGAVVQSAIEQLARAEGLTHAQALLRMAELALVAVNDSEHPPRPLRGDERAAIMIHLDVGALDAPARPEGEAPEARPAERGRTEAPPAESLATRWAGRPAARLAGGPGLPDSVVRKLLCAGRIRTAVHDGNGNVRDLGRSHRVVTERQFRALLMRDKWCSHPGCTSRAGLQAHHVRHWISGGRTDLSNLVLLCEAHHHALHDGKITIVSLGAARFQFVRHDGRVLSEHIDPTRLTDTDAPLENEFPLRWDAAESGWDGERLDRKWAIAVLAQRRQRAERRPAKQA